MVNDHSHCCRGPIPGAHHSALTGWEWVCPAPLPNRANALLLRRTQTPLGSGLSLSHLPPRALAMRACSSLKDTIFALEKNRWLICPRKGNRNWKSCLKPKLEAPGSRRWVCYLCLSPKPSDRASVPAATRKTLPDPSVPATCACKAREGRHSAELF